MCKYFQNIHFGSQIFRMFGTYRVNRKSTYLTLIIKFIRITTELFYERLKGR